MAPPPLVPVTIAGVATMAACTDDAESAHIELRDLQFSRVLTRQLTQQTIAVDSALHAELLRTARQHLQVPAQEPFSKLQTLCQLQELSVALSETYRAATGLAAPVFVIDPQEVRNGVLHMSVLEAELETFELAEEAVDLDRQTAQQTIQAQLSTLVGQALHQDALERSLLRLQYITGREYKALLSPGTQSLGVKVSLQPQPKQRINGQLSADNHGTAATGNHQGSAVLLWQPAWVQGDQVTASYISSETHSALNAYTMAYERPLGYQGLRGGVRGGQTNYALGGVFAAAQATGQSTNYSAYLQYLLSRSLTHSTEATFGVSGMDLLDNTPTGQNPRHHDVVWAEVRGTNKQPRAIQSWGASLTEGFVYQDSAGQTASDATNMQLQGKFQLINIDFKHSQALGKSLDLTASYRVQWSSKNLDSYHKMAIGGSNAVRAFAAGEVTGDQAQLLRTELGHSQRIYSSTHRFSAFYDWAQLSINHSPLAANAANNQQTIAGVGLQWEIQLDMGLSGRLYWARPQGGDRSASAVDSKNERLGVDVSYRF